ncbi:MAG: Hsp20/alpha crystallin family protein [Planctomycetota bacterium]|nr:MAG: Hsp20/alpha crystallin family protein [Planctomycetota bacterium]
MFTPFFELDAPVRSLRRLSNFARLMDEVGHWFEGSHDGPQANVYINDHGAVVQLAVPGYRREQLHVEAERDTLIIRGEPEQAAADSSEATQPHMLRQEIARGPFMRRIQLPFSIDGEHTEARHENGVLCVAVAKPKAEQPRRIAIA